MTTRDQAMPEPNRSAAEIEFVLRNAGRRSGPEVLRDLARAEHAPEKKGVKRLRRDEGLDPI